MKWLINKIVGSKNQRELKKLGVIVNKINELETEFQSQTLDSHNLVVDIGLAHEALHRVLAVINYKNLDDLNVFDGQNTTTEFLAAWIWQQIVDEIKAGKLGSHTLCGLSVNLRESDVAWASYEAPLG